MPTVAEVIEFLGVHYGPDETIRATFEPPAWTAGAIVETARAEGINLPQGAIEEILEEQHFAVEYDCGILHSTISDEIAYWLDENPQNEDD